MIDICDCNKSDFDNIMNKLESQISYEETVHSDLESLEIQRATRFEALLQNRCREYYSYFNQ